MTRLALALVLTLVMVACGGPNPNQPPVAPTGVITGTLTDNQGKPVADAQVVLGDASTSSLAVSDALTPAAAAIDTTNSRGQFALDVDEEGEYTLTVLLDREGAHSRVSVTRDPSGRLISQPVEMATAPLGGVSGSIGGKGAGVWAYLLGTSFLATTSSDGTFVISRVPAGTYHLAAGMLGASGPAVEVTVEAGETKTVATPLELGPVITNVTPSEAIYGDSSSNPIPAFRIFGRGFGSDRGTSEVRYAGVQVTDAVTSWTDNEIVLDPELVHWQQFLYYNIPVDVDDLRFEVVTPAGTAASAGTGYYRADLRNYGCTDPHGTLSVYMYASTRPLAGATLDLSVTRSRILENPGGQTISQLTPGPGCAEAYVEWDSPEGLPAVVRANVSDPDFLEPQELQVIMYPPQIWFDFDVYSVPAGPYVVEGTMLGWHDYGSGAPDPRNPVVDDGHFTVHVDSDPPADEGGRTIPLELDASGVFTFEVDMPESACHTLSFAYQAIEFDNTWQICS